MTDTPDAVKRVMPDPPAPKVGETRPLELDPDPDPVCHFGTLDSSAIGGSELPA